jgi:hypothetical protein
MVAMMAKWKADSRAGLKAAWKAVSKDDLKAGRTVD